MAEQHLPEQRKTVKSKKLTQAHLKEALDYDPKTGIFTWKVNPGRKIKAGTLAGLQRRDGRIFINIENKHYRAHRLAWLLIHGYFPENGVDHIDRDPSNNRIGNLREATQVCNIRNCGNFKHNRSGVKGVVWQRRDCVWHARVQVNGKNRSLGYYEDFDDAVCARLAAEQCLDWAGCDSSSPAYQHVYMKGV